MATPTFYCFAGYRGATVKETIPALDANNLPIELPPITLTVVVFV